jgi:hypothetical protein
MGMPNLVDMYQLMIQNQHRSVFRPVRWGVPLQQMQINDFAIVYFLEATPTV